MELLKKMLAIAFATAIAMTVTSDVSAMKSKNDGSDQNPAANKKAKKAKRQARARYAKNLDPQNPKYSNGQPVKNLEDLNWLLEKGLIDPIVEQVEEINIDEIVNNVDQNNGMNVEPTIVQVTDVILNAGFDVQPVDFVIVENNGMNVEQPNVEEINIDEIVNNVEKPAGISDELRAMLEKAAKENAGMSESEEFALIEKAILEKAELEAMYADSCGGFCGDSNLFAFMGDKEAAELMDAIAKSEAPYQSLTTFVLSKGKDVVVNTTKTVAPVAKENPKTTTMTVGGLVLGFGTAAVLGTNPIGWAVLGTLGALTGLGTGTVVNQTNNIVQERIMQDNAQALENQEQQQAREYQSALGMDVEEQPKQDDKQDEQK